MSDALAAYRKALGDYAAARSRVLRLGELFASVGQQIKKDWRLVLIGTSGAMTAAAAGRPEQAEARVNGHEWPSAGQLAEAIRATHDAHLAVRTTWARIPEEQRDVVIPPPAD